MKDYDEAKLCKLIWPEGCDDDDSPLQRALEFAKQDSGAALQEWVERGEGTPAELQRLAAVRTAWPSHLYGPLYHQRGRTRGDRTATYTPFDRYAAGRVIKEKAARLEKYAKYEPPRTRLGPGELEDLIPWGMREAEKEFPGGKQTESESIIRYLVRRPERL